MLPAIVVVGFRAELPGRPLDRRHTQTCSLDPDAVARPGSTYTITIAVDDVSATTPTLRLDMSGGEVLLTDLHLHAGKGLSTGQIPAIDYGLLLRAIASATPTPLTTSPTAAPATATGLEPGSPP